METYWLFRGREPRRYEERNNRAHVEDRCFSYVVQIVNTLYIFPLTCLILFLCVVAKGQSREGEYGGTLKIAMTLFYELQESEGRHH